MISFMGGCSDSDNGSGASVENVATYHLTLSPSSSTIFPLNSDVTISWEARDVASPRYNVFFGNDQANLGVFLYDTAATSYTFDSLDPGLYFWQVDLVVNGRIVAKSQIYMFEISSKSEGFVSPPTLQAPLNGSVLNMGVVTLKWSDAVGLDKGAIYYSIYVGSSPYDLHSVVRNISQTDYEYILDEPGTYYWRVVASYGNGETISSIVWNFSVAKRPEVLEKPELIYPDTGQSVSGELILQWKGDSSSYRVYISKDPDSFTTFTEVDGDYFHPELSDGGIYYWKVSYVSNGVEVFSDTRWFRYDVKKYLHFKQVSTSALEGDRGNGCGITEEGDLYCWGFNDGALPFGEVGSSYTYTRVDSLGKVKRVSLGYGGGCVVNLDDELWCWGMDRHNFQGGGYIAPHRIATDKKVKDVSVGDGFLCAILYDDTLACMGVNNKGQLGSGSYVKSAQLTPLDLDGDVVKVSAGSDFACALVKNGFDTRAYCWGNNDRGQLGAGSGVTSSTQPLLLDGTAWSDISAGFDHACGIKNGELYCWGDNSFHQVSSSLDGSYDQPQKIPEPGSAARIYASYNYSCAIIGSGAVYCWGSNADVDDLYGEDGVKGFGRALMFDLGSPVPILVSKDILFYELSFSRSGGCGISQSGDLYCWGDRRNRSLGEATIYQNSRYFPPFYVGKPPGGWKKIEVTTMVNANATIYNNPDGRYYVNYGGDIATACGLTNEGDIYCWGYNYGNADPLSRTPHYRYFPRRMNIDSAKFKSLSISPLNIIAMTNDDNVYLALDYYNLERGELYYNWQLWNPGSIWHFDPGPIGVVAATSNTFLMVTDQGAAYYFKDPYYRWSQRRVSYSGVIGVVKTEGQFCLLRENGMDCYQEKIYLMDYFVGFDPIYSADFSYDKVVLLTHYHEVWYGGNPLTFCILTDGRITCYGDNSVGQLGIGKGRTVTSPFETYVVNDLGTGWKDIFGGEDNVCALDVEDNLWCWGDNRNEVFGEPAGIFYKPHLVTSLPAGLRYMSFDLRDGCGVDKNGGGWCWGLNYYGTRHTNYRDIPLRLETYSSPFQILIEER